MRVLALIVAIMVVFPYVSSSESQPCDYKVDILLNETEYNISSFKWRMRAIKVIGNPTNTTGTAEIVN